MHTWSKTSHLILLFLLWYSTMPSSLHASYDDYYKEQQKGQTLADSLLTIGGVALVALGVTAATWGLCELFKETSQHCLHRCQQRCNQLKMHYRDMLEKHITEKNLTKKITAHFYKKTYPILSFKDQLLTDIERLMSDKRDVEHHVHALSKKIYNKELDPFQHQCSISLYHELSDLHCRQELLLDRLEKLCTQVRQLPRCEREERRQRKERQKQEMINALNKPAVTYNYHYDTTPCHCHSSLYC